MRFVRVLLLVLLTVMLPVRGVMAAAMLCAPPSGAGEAHASRADHDSHHACESGHDHEGVAGKSTCNLCSACCSVPPLPSAAPVLPSPRDTAAARFPSFSAPAPTFQSEGPERPPRSV